MNNLSKCALSVAIALSLSACVSDSKDDDNNDVSDTVTMTLEASNLEALGAGYDYEGWIIVDGVAVTTGTFDIVNGITEPSSFTLNREQAEAAATFVLTIEPEGETPEQAAMPAATHILAGPITDGISNIVTDHPAAFGTDFSADETAGTFIVATPTNGNATPTRGIWYLTPTDEGNVASLTLPTLPEGWIYEGWVVDTSVFPPVPVSTGTFSGPNGADSDDAGLTAGDMPFPPFPGQDFITDLPVVNLVGQMSVISVEPVPDNSSAPFSMKPLSSVIQVTGNELEHDSGTTLPSGTVTINF